MLCTCICMHTIEKLICRLNTPSSQTHIFTSWKRGHALDMDWPSPCIDNQTTKQLPYLVQFSRLVLLIFFFGNQLLQQFSDDLTAVFFRCFCTDSTNKQGFLYHQKPMAPAEKKKVLQSDSTIQWTLTSLVVPKFLDATLCGPVSCLRPVVHWNLGTPKKVASYCWDVTPNGLSLNLLQAKYVH